MSNLVNVNLADCFVLRGLQLFSESGICMCFITPSSLFEHSRRGLLEYISRFLSLSAVDAYEAYALFPHMQQSCCVSFFEPRAAPPPESGLCMTGSGLIHDMMPAPGARRSGARRGAGIPKTPKPGSRAYGAYWETGKSLRGELLRRLLLKVQS